MTLRLFDRLTRAVADYEEAVEIEADERLYVRPLLEFADLLQLHARHCYEVRHGEPATQARLARLFSASQQLISARDRRCARAGAIDEGDLRVTSLGRVGAGVVQSCHHAWVDACFEDLASGGLRHPDRETLQPKLYGLVRLEIERLHTRLGPDHELRIAILRLEKLGAKARISIGDLATASGVSLRTMEGRAATLRAAGILAPGKRYALSEKGEKEAESARSILLDWTRAVSAAMTAWSAGEL